MNRYWIAFWVVSFIYGSSFMLNDIALNELNPLEIGFLRYGIAAIGLIGISLYRRSPLALDRKAIIALTLVGIGNHAIPFAIVVWAQTRIDSGLTGVLMATVPLYSLVVAHFVFADERMTPQKTLGVLLGFVGIVILSSCNFTADGVDSRIEAELSIVFAAAVISAATIYSRRVMQGRIDVTVTATWTMITSSIFMLGLIIVGALISGDAGALASGAVSGEIWLVMLTMALVNTLIGNYLYYFVVTGVGAARSTLVTYVFPPVSLALGAIFLDEVIDARILLGVAVIFSGLALATAQARAPQPVESDA